MHVLGVLRKLYVNNNNPILFCSSKLMHVSSTSIAGYHHKQMGHPKRMNQPIATEPQTWMHLCLRLGQPTESHASHVMMQSSPAPNSDAVFIQVFCFTPKQTDPSSTRHRRQERGTPRVRSNLQENQNLLYVEKWNECSSWSAARTSSRVGDSKEQRPSILVCSLQVHPYEQQ